MQQPDSYYQQPQHQQQQVPLMISAGPPTMNFQHPQSPQNLVRYRHSCEHCRKRKIKCSGTRPVCDHCLRRGIQCIYKPLARTPRRTVSTGSSGGKPQQQQSTQNNHGAQPISIPTSNAFLSPLASSSYLHTDIASAPAFHSMSPLLGYGIPLNGGGSKTQQLSFGDYGSLPKSIRSPAPAIPSHMYYSGGVMSPNNMTMQSPLTYGSLSDNISGTPGSFTSMQSDFSDASPSHMGFNHVPATPTKTSSSVDTVGMLGSGFLGLQVDDPPMNHASMHQATSFGQMHSQQHPGVAFANQGPPVDFSLPDHLGSNGDLQSDANHQHKETDDSTDNMPLLERSAMEQQFDYNRLNNVNGSGGISDEILGYYFSTTQQQQAVGNGVGSGSGGIVPGLTLYQHAGGSPQQATNTAMASDFGNGDITKR